MEFAPSDFNRLMIDVYNADMSVPFEINSINYKSIQSFQTSYLRNLKEIKSLSG
jgi:hypothetical protein